MSAGMSQLRRTDLAPGAEGMAYDVLTPSLDAAGQVARQVLLDADRDGDSVLREAEIDAVFAALDAMDGRVDEVITTRDGSSATLVAEVYDEILLAHLGGAIARAGDARGSRPLAPTAVQGQAPSPLAVAAARLSDGPWVAVHLEADAPALGVPPGGFGDPELYRNGLPSITWAMRRLDSPRKCEWLERCLEQTRAVFADTALLLAVTSREHPSAWTATSSDRIHTFHEGGLDNLGRWLSRGSLEGIVGRDVLRRWHALRETTNGEHPDRPVRIRPALIPARDQMLAYAAALAWHERLFEAHVRDVFREDADRLLAEMSVDARRAWIQATLGGPAGRGARAPHYDPVQRRFETEGRMTTAVSAYAALERIRESARERGVPPSLDDIFTDPLLARLQRFQRARTTALEARLLDRAGLGCRRTEP